MDNELFLGLWELFKPYIPQKEIQVVAGRYVEICEDNGVDLSRLDDIQGADEILDAALVDAGVYEEDFYDDFNEYEDE